MLVLLSLINKSLYQNDNNNLLKPYLFETTKKVEKYLNSNINSWNYQKLEKVELVKEINPLFIRYDKKVIDEERELLKNKD